MTGMWDTIDETENQPFWICWHACMLFLHGVITKQEFDKIYNDQINKS